MKYEKLKAYMETLASLEQEHLLISETLDCIEKKRRELGTEAESLKQQTRFTWVPRKMSYGIGNVIGVIIGSLIPLFFIFWGWWYVGFLLNKFLGDTGLYLAIGSFAAIAVVLFTRNVIKDKKRARAEWEQNNRRMELEFERKEQRCDSITQGLPDLDDRKQHMQTALQSCENVLKAYYGLDVLPRDARFRGFVPVLTILQYLETGRTYSLERNPQAADPGALNMYIDELYQNRIVSELKQINQNLKKVQEQQTMLYEAYCESNRQIALLTQSVSQGFEQLHHDNQIAEFSRQQIQKDTRRMRELTEYTDTSSLV